MLKTSLQKNSINSPPEEGCPQGGVVETKIQKNNSKDTFEETRNTAHYFSLPYNPKLKERAKALRKAGNLSEALFWQQIKKRQFKNLDFDRQKIIGNYIVDSYCASLGLILEIDGSTHNDKEEYDKVRDLFFENLGLIVIHIEDKEIKKNLNGVMMWLEENEVFRVLESQPPRQLRCHPSVLRGILYPHPFLGIIFP